LSITQIIAIKKLKKITMNEDLISELDLAILHLNFACKEKGSFYFRLKSNGKEIDFCHCLL